MNRNEYNQVIDWTLKHEESAQTEDSLETTRAVLTNMGISLPQGDLQQVSETLATNDYMGWRSCSVKEAQEYANNGTAVVGVSDEQITVVAANTEDESEVGAESASIMTLSESTSALAVSDTVFYVNRASTTGYPYVDIPQDGDIGTFISYMGYHRITDTSSDQYKLKHHAINNDRYSISCPQYYAQIDNRIVIATKPNIGNQLSVSIGDYVQVRFEYDSGGSKEYPCIIGDFKGEDADNIWGHYDGKGVVEVIYHNYSPDLTYYNKNQNNPWGSGRVTRITKVGRYGNYQ